MSLTMPGVYFLPLRVCALCCVETTTLVQPTGLPSTYFTVTWLLASGCRSNSCAGAALLRQHLEDLVREIDRRRHERALFVDLALGAGEAEHHALVAGAFLLAALLLLGVDAHGDVGRLAVQQHLDVGAVIGEAVLVVADILDHAAGDFGDQSRGRPPPCRRCLWNSGAWPRPSPAMTILLVVHSVSQPSRVLTLLSSAMPSLTSFSRKHRGWRRRSGRRPCRDVLPTPTRW